MTAFWAITGLLVAAALAFVLPSLLRRGARSAGADAVASNVAIYRDQLRELDADLAAGTLKPEQHAEARREIEHRMLEDVDAGPAPAAQPQHRSRAAAAVGVGVPLVAALVYFMVGSPGALAPGAADRDGHGITVQQIEGMVERLAARMKEDPDDPRGWTMLGRSYAVLDRFSEAAAAYAEAVKRSPPDAQLLADYADALAMAQGRTLEGEPARIIARALEVDPNNVKALALAGTAEFEKHNFKGAIAHWEKILAVVPADSDMAESVRDSIADARRASGAAPAAAAPAKPAAPATAGIAGTVRLSPELAAKASPGDTVFIFARPAEGPRLPLAVVRRQVRDLPVAFTLDDTMAMTPAAKLSDHARVTVGARISRSGAPEPRPGDLEGYASSPVARGARGVTVTIDTEVR